MVKILSGTNFRIFDTDSLLSVCHVIFGPKGFVRKSFFNKISFLFFLSFLNFSDALKMSEDNVINTFISQILNNQPTIRYVKCVELAKQAKILNKSSILAEQINEKIKETIFLKKYENLSDFLSYEEKLRQNIILMCKIFSPIRKLNLYKKFKRIFKNYAIKNIESLQNEIYTDENCDKDEITKVLSRYRILNRVYKFLKKKIISTNLKKLESAQNKEEEIEMVDKFINETIMKYICQEKIRESFLNEYLSRSHDIYKISLTEMFGSFYMFYKRSKFTAEIDSILAECFKKNISFEYLMNVEVFPCNEHILIQVMRKNEHLVFDNVHLLKNMPKKNWNFILRKMNQTDSLEKNYRKYIANRILRKEDVSDELDVYMETYKPYKHNYDPYMPYDSDREDEEDAIGGKREAEVFDIPGKGQYVLRNQIFKKIHHIIENKEKPVLDFRWPQYAELNFEFPDSLSKLTSINHTLSTVKIYLLGHNLICTAFQFTILKFICANYKNTNLIKNKIGKSEFEDLEDKKEFFSEFLSNENERQVFYDHLEQICNILQSDLTLKIEEDCNLCPKFRLKSDTETVFDKNIVQVVDAHIMKILKKKKTCDRTKFYDKHPKKTVDERIEYLEQKGYCTVADNNVSYCP